MTDWGDVVARVRGLSTRLLSPADRVELESAPDAASLARALASLVGPSPDADALAPAQVEAAGRRHAGALLAIVERWAGPRAPRLDVLLLDEDHHSLRVLLRGLLAGTAPEARVAVALPTARLPVRALERLAGIGDVAGVGALLRAWQHPLAGAVEAEAARQRPQLLELDLALARAWAAAARGAAGRDPDLRHYVARQVDAANLLGAWGACQDEEFAATDWRIAGGAVTAALPAPLPDRDGLARWLAPRVAGTPLEPLADPVFPHEGASRALLEREFRDRSRAAPVSTATVVHFILRLRRDLELERRAAWGVALGIPPSRRRALAEVAA